MVIRLNMINDSNNKVPRRTAGAAAAKSNKDTKKEFKRLKTILPSIRKKENVSKLDIILEAIKYIDDLTEQLEHRLDEEEGVDPDAERSGSENIVLHAAPAEVRREAAAVMALAAAEAQMATSAASSGFYSDESPGEDRLLNWSSKCW